MDNEVKQIELFTPVRRIPLRKKYIYRGACLYRGPYEDWFDDNHGLSTSCNSKVDVYVSFRNDKASGLGMPLPAGPVRFMKRDPSDWQLELVGSALIDHVPQDEAVSVRLGNAFDVIGARNILNFKEWTDEDTVRSHIEETIEIRIRNHKCEPVDVEVREFMYRGFNWEIIEASEKILKSLSSGWPEQTDCDLPEWHKVLMASAKKDRIDYVFADTQWDEAVRFIAEESGADIIIDPDVQNYNVVTLRVEDMPLPLALKRLLTSAGLDVGLKNGRVFVTDDFLKFDRDIITKEYSIPDGFSSCAFADYIQSQTGYELWDPDIGASIECRDDKMVIATNTAEIHTRIADLIKTLELKMSARKIRIPVTVAANGERIVTYTVRYTR
ncbi:MAG TPA: hypothetical protein ENN09_07515 [Planctomycetes bacterium]|nr:hypothetical protein [Planctomycetota bacterium]